MDLTSKEQQLEDRVCVLEAGQKKILDILEPISDTYRTVSTLGKWSMAALVLISIIIGILLGVKQLKH